MGEGRKRPIKKIIVEDDNDEIESTNANTPLIQKMLQKQLEHSLMISDLKNQLADTKNDIKLTRDDVKKILRYIENDHTTGEKGIVARVKEVETSVEAHEHFKENIEGKAWGLFVASGVIAALISFILNKIINKI